TRWRRSRMARRASSSSNSAACEAVDAQRTAAAPAACQRRKRSGSISAVSDFSAAVLRPHGLAAAFHGRLFLAEAHRLDLVVGHAKQGERTAHRFGALLAQGQVVFTAA